MPYLIQKGLVEIKPLAPPPNPPPRGYDANATCDFHAGSLGHTNEKCLALKFKVQDLLDRKVIYFAPEGQNVKGNPMPGHYGSTINAVEGLDDKVLTQVVGQVRIHMSRVYEKLIGYKAFERLRGKICLINPTHVEG